MGIFDPLKGLFSPKNPGLLLDGPDILAKLPRHEDFYGGGEPKDWSDAMPAFRYQGPTYWCTAYAGTSISSALDHEERGGRTMFSPMELFYRSGGSMKGNYLLTTADGMRDFVVLESDVPTKVPSSWNQASFEEAKKASKAGPHAVEFGKQFRTKSHASVIPDARHLRSALVESPIMVAVGIGRGFFDKVAPRQTQYSAYHAVVLTKIEDDGRYRIFDSLTQRSDFDGFHYLAPDYEILSALSFVDLPSEIPEPKKEGALAQYGKKRVLAWEQHAAGVLYVASKDHPTLSAYMGREWLKAVNAVAYGGYSVQDLLNHWTSMRRGQGPIFDLDKVRRTGA